MVSAATIPIGIYGSDSAADLRGRGCGLWPPGYAGAVSAAGGLPVVVRQKPSSIPWDGILDSVAGIVLAESRATSAKQAADEEALCDWCRRHSLPMLAVDRGLHVLNLAFGGSIYFDLARDCPEALQHRHPPERGLRHAIMVERGTRLAGLYGEGEIVVNSEHRRGVDRVARGFRVSARALDRVIEAIEPHQDNWFVVGVQWHPASASASGLDIQLFRGLVDAARQRMHKPARATRSAVA